MEILSIMNGAADPRMREEIKKYSLLKGFATWTPKETPEKAEFSHRTVLVIADRKGPEIYKEEIVKFHEKCPVEILFSRENVIRYPDRNGDFQETSVTCSLSFQKFQKILSGYICEEKMKNRRYYFGKLQMERKQPLLIENGREIKMGPYEFKVLFFMLEHIGKVVSREEINGILPLRKRNGRRNVDTHIKNLRRRLNLNDAILSVRSVGYRIDEERFYQKMTGKD